MDQKHKKKKYKKHTNIKRVIFKPILIYMQPKYCSKATINFNYFLPNKPILLTNYLTTLHIHMILLLLSHYWGYYNIYIKLYNKNYKPTKNNKIQNNKQ